MPVEWIGVRCAECRTYQCIQRPKPKGKRHPSSRFSCRLCSHQQTLLTIFAVSYNASDVREAVQRKNAARQDEELQSDRRLLERLQQRQAEDEDEDEEEEELQRRDFADTEDVAFYAEKVEAAYRPAEGRGGRADEPSNAGRSRRRQDADRWDAAVSGQRTAGWGETAPAEPQPHRHHDEADDEDAASPPLARGTKRRWMSEEAEQEQQQQQQRVWERERTTLPPQQPFRTEEGQDENEVSAPVAVDGGGEGVAPAPATDGAVSALVDVAWTVDASALSEAALDALLSEAEQTAG